MSSGVDKHALLMEEIANNEEVDHASFPRLNSNGGETEQRRDWPHLILIDKKHKKYLCQKIVFFFFCSYEFWFGLSIVMEAMLCYYKAKKEYNWFAKTEKDK